MSADLRLDQDDRVLERLSLPVYPVMLSARLAGTAPGTVSRWYYGYMKPSGPRAPRVLGDRRRGIALSYLQLVEVAMIATFRDLGVSLKRLSLARDFLASRFNARYPFAQLDLKSDGAHVMKDLEDTGKVLVSRLVVASQHGQIAWAGAVEKRIQEFDYDTKLRIAMRWYPRGADGPILVDPMIAFGAPITRVGSISTAVITGRYKGGEEPDEIAADFRIPLEMVHGALEFERVPSFVAVA